MIRINLLPFRLARKKENIRQQISIFFLLVALVIMALFYTTLYMNKKIRTIKQETQQVNLNIKKYKEKAQRVMKIKSDLKSLEKKLEVVNSLKKQRNKQLILFDQMTGLVIPGRMWIESLQTDMKTVKIKGIAFDNPTIADFMQTLENSPLFEKVDLKSSQMKEFTDGVMLTSFDLVCLKAKSKEEIAKELKNQKKKKRGKKGKK